MRERQIVEMKSSGPVQTSNFSFTELNYLFGSTQIIKIDRWFTRRTFLSYLLRALLDTSLYSMLIIFPSSFVTFRRCFLPNFFQCWYWSPDLPLHKQCKMQRIFRLARQEFLPLKTQSSGYRLSCYNLIKYILSCQNTKNTCLYRQLQSAFSAKSPFFSTLMRMLMTREVGCGIKKMNHNNLCIRFRHMKSSTFALKSLHSRTDRLDMSNLMLGSTQITSVELNWFKRRSPHGLY